MKKHLLLISCVLLILSVLAISYGANLQANSRQFDLYQQYVMNDMAARHPGDALAPEFGIGLVLASAWPIVGSLHGLICTFFLVGLLWVRNNKICFGNRSSFIFTSLLFALFCAISSLHYAYIALDSFVWSFHMRGVGELFTAIGLLAVAYSVFCEIKLPPSMDKITWRKWNTKQINIPTSST